MNALNSFRNNRELILFTLKLLNTLYALYLRESTSPDGQK